MGYKCTRCLAFVREQDRFCSYCHAPISRPSEKPAEPESAPSPPLEASNWEPPAALPERTGREDLLAALVSLFGPLHGLRRGPPQGIKEFAIFRLSEPSPHWVVATLNYTELGTALYAYEESGRGHEYFARVAGEQVPDWLLEERDWELQLGEVRCDEQEFARFPTVNGRVRLVELRSPAGEFFKRDHLRIAPKLAASEDLSRLELRWSDAEGSLSLIGTTLLGDGIQHLQSRTAAEEALRRAYLRTRRVLQRTLVRHPRRDPVMHSDEALEALARGSSAHARVYADWLMERDDLRGALAQLILGGDQAGLRIFWALEGEGFLGELASALDLQLHLSSWRDGFLDEALLTDGPVGLSALLDGFLEATLSHSLTGLQLGSTESATPALLAQVVDSHLAPHLLRLSLNVEGGPVRSELSWTRPGDLSRLCELPRLEALLVRGGLPASYGRLDAPSLHQFSRISGGLTREEWAELVAARWPALRELSLWTGSAEYGCTVGVAELDALLATPLKNLEAFGLVNCEFSPEALPVLAGSPLLRRVRRVDLSRGVLNDDDVPLLERLAPQLRALDSVDLSENLFSAGAVAHLQARLPNAKLDAQRTGDEGAGRFVAVGE